MKHDSLRKQPSFLAACHLGCFARRDVCTSTTEIPYWWRKIYPESASEFWLVDTVVIVLAIVYERQAKCKRSYGSNVNAMDLPQYSPFSWNIFFFGKGIWVLLELVRRRKQNFTIIDQERHLKLNKLTFGALWLPDLLCKHWFTSSVWYFCRWCVDFPSGETSLAKRSEEGRLFLQARDMNVLFLSL